MLSDRSMTRKIHRQESRHSSYRSLVDIRNRPTAFGKHNGRDRATAPSLAVKGSINLLQYMYTSREGLQPSNGHFHIDNQPRENDHCRLLFSRKIDILHPHHEVRGARTAIGTPAIYAILLLLFLFCPCRG
jgi:hypothetical protein